MIRVIVSLLVFTTLLLLAGCWASGGAITTNDTWFQQQNEAFDRQRADQMKQGSDAVDDYLRYRNQ